MFSPSLKNWIDSLSVQRESWKLPMQAPAPEDEITRLCVACRARLGLEPPADYLNLLRITNGFDENGMQVYASQRSRNSASEILGGDYFIPGFVEENEQLRADREDYDQLLVFGQTALYVYALVVDTDKYIVLAHDDQEASETYGHFDELMRAALRKIVKPHFWPA